MREFDLGCTNNSWIDNHIIYRSTKPWPNHQMVIPSIFHNHLPTLTKSTMFFPQDDNNPTHPAFSWRSSSNMMTCRKVSMAVPLKHHPNSTCFKWCPIFFRNHHPPKSTKLNQNDPKWWTFTKMDVQNQNGSIHRTRCPHFPSPDHPWPPLGSCATWWGHWSSATSCPARLISCSRLLEGVPRCWGWKARPPGQRHSAPTWDCRAWSAPRSLRSRYAAHGNCHSALRVDVDLESFVCWHSFTGALSHYAVYKRNESRNIFYPSSFLSPFVIELADNKCWVLL